MIKNVESRNILQGLFDKWNGKSEEVINEAKVEDVQTTIIAQTPHLFHLRFERKGRNVSQAYYGDIHIGDCYPKEEESFEDYFNYLKFKNTPIPAIQEEMKGKYMLRNGKRGKSKKKTGRPKGRFTNDKYTFRKERGGRLLLSYRFDKTLESVCRCGEGDEKKIIEELEILLEENYSKAQIKYLLKNKYDGRKTRWQNKTNKQSIHKEAPKVPLAKYSWNDRGFLLKNGENTKIVPADFNDIESVLINNGSTRSVVSLLPNCDYEALMDLSKYCKTDEYAALRRAGINIMNNK